ncbi:hypothetical protein QR680_004935 [Steinernema hermaphroditum]|uniref:Globin domain-containing protein n=1 Tax=Steinernema hermaphroditum TaxID=289476 RepID=A0AA39LUH2_9BILA|nr:hypothetical protein QR680_004935 [Steinernema hermaphroditum]
MKKENRPRRYVSIPRPLLDPQMVVFDRAMRCIQSAMIQMHNARSNGTVTGYFRKRKDSRCSTVSSSTGSSASAIYRIGSHFSSRVLQLDEEQIDTIVDAFAKISDKYGAFERVFIQLFVYEDKEIAEQFGLANVPEEVIKRNQVFRTHVGKFQRFMTTVVELLPKVGREDELIEILRIVGRQHCNVKQMNFTAAKWLSFKNVLLSVLCKTDHHDKVYMCWNQLVSFLIYEIKDAYLDQVRRLRSNSCPHILEAGSFDIRKYSLANIKAHPEVP